MMSRAKNAWPEPELAFSGAHRKSGIRDRFSRLKDQSSTQAAAFTLAIEADLTDEPMRRRQHCNLKCPQHRSAGWTWITITDPTVPPDPQTKK